MRSIPDELGNSKLIQLTQGKFAVVDAADYEWLNDWTWVHNNGYAVRNEGPRTERVHISMHRAIVEAPTGILVDHINGNRLDNRRNNLRLATRSQNGVNRGKALGAYTSTYKGVYLKQGRWAACIHFQCKQIYIGTYETEIEAARAYDRKSLELFGDFAAPNFREE